ncbi:hypothetical protein Tsubulata_036438 [Turnera subulata]|uniref:Reverse transcriptase zinc-binding domain-containing protein n=1 Tax=Turnera subulata TaxID=218843 RepID=A0A9Q0IZ46_9ROSI|nr:hypothetical protein Tsubulata_036438 [Turnera subulata]
MVLFVEAEVSQILVIKQCLQLFCDCSGQKVSASKTQIFFSTNVPDSVREQFHSGLGYTITDDLGTYLGVPLIHRRVTRQTYVGVLERVSRRLSSWQSHLLSFAGRVTLKQSVLASLPLYTMQTVLLPVSLVQDLERPCRGFIWGSSGGVRRVHLTPWRLVCSPKAQGGLGLHCLSFLNQAMLAKLCWGVVASPSALWVQVLRAKYLCQREAVLLTILMSSCSALWRGMSCVWHVVFNGLQWAIGDGKVVQFWEDAWVDDVGPLRLVALGPIPEQDVSLPVAAYALPLGFWDWSKFQHLLPASICFKIARVPCPSVAVGADMVYWRHTASDQFTTSSTYFSAVEADAASGDSIWPMI